MAARASAPPVYLWLEAEWFDGVQGSFAYWTGTAKPTGTWAVAGPGISPEWTQGGESEWNSTGAPAAETKAECHRDVTVPRAGKYRVWVRYVDHRKKTEPFTAAVLQGDKVAAPRSWASSRSCRKTTNTSSIGAFPSAGRRSTATSPRDRPASG